MAVHDGRVFRPMADALAEHGGDDAAGGPLHQLPGKAAADAVAHIEEFADAEVVHQPELVVGKRIPRVIDLHRTGGFAAIGVALVHGYAAEVVLELFHRVDRRGRPIADARIEAAARGYQEREAGAGLLVANAGVALLVERHGSLLRRCGRRARRGRGSAQADVLSQSGEVSEALRSKRLRCTKEEVQVHLRRTALDEGHPLPRRAAVGSCRDLCSVTALGWLFASIRRAIEPPSGPTPAAALGPLS